MQTIKAFTQKLILCLCTATVLTACNDREPAPESTEPNATLTITLKDKAATRATGAALPTDEAQINRIAVGIFKSSGEVNTIKEVEFTPSSGTQTATIPCRTGNNLTVIVVANAPKGTFSGLLYKDDFLQKQVSLSQTVAQGDTYQAATNLPMSGTNNILSIITGAVNNVSIELSRLVARVSLSSVKTNFAGGAYANATFKLTDIYMYNVTSTSTVDPDNPVTSGMTYGLDETGQITPNAAPYLHHAVDHQFPSGGDITQAYWFYVFANSSKDNKTKLVLKGEFDEDGSGPLPASTTYYPITVNLLKSGTTWDGGTVAHDGTIAINTAYDITVTIKNKGTSGPDVDPTPADLYVTVTVKDWALKIKQNVTFE